MKSNPATHCSDMGATSGSQARTLLVALCTCTALGSVNGLSWPFCNNSALEWTTNSPHVTGAYPFSNLLCAPCLPALLQHHRLDR